MLPEWSAAERLPEIQVPTLIVVGEADIPDVHAHAGVLEAGIAASERVVLEGAGHLVFFERPAEFNRLVLKFLEGVGW
jgi:pimeloyl-ACP methyl ester carboxylesterase